MDRRRQQQHEEANRLLQGTQKGALVMVLQRLFQKPSSIGRDATRKRSRVWATTWHFWRFQLLKGLASWLQAVTQDLSTYNSRRGCQCQQCISQ